MAYRSNSFGGGYPSQQLQSSDPLDRLGKLTAIQNAGQQGDMDMLHSLYGIQQSQQLAPEHLRALQDSNAAKEFETSRGQQMLPYELQDRQNAQSTFPENLRGLQTSNDARQFETDKGRAMLPYGISEAQHNQAWAEPNAQQEYGMRGEKVKELQGKNESDAFSRDWAQPNEQANYDLKTAQTGRLNAESQEVKRPHLDINHLSLMHQVGLISDEDLAHGMISDPLYASIGQNMLTHISAKNAEKAAGIAQDQATQHPNPSAAGVTVPSGYENDPEIQTLLRKHVESKKNPGFFDPISTQEIQRRRAVDDTRRQTNPISQGLRDLWSLYD